MIPYTLMNATLISENRNNVRILDTSVFGFTYRLIHENTDTIKKIIVHIYDYASKCYEDIVLDDFIITIEENNIYYDVYRVETENEQYKKQIRTLMQQYNRYIDLKSGNGDLSNELCHYPSQLDSLYHLPDLSLQADRQYTDLLKQHDLAVVIDNEELYQLYLQYDFDKFIKLYYKRYHLDKHPLCSGKYTYLYVGNQFCHFLFPEMDMLSSICEKAKKEYLKVVLCFPPVKEGWITSLRSVLESIDETTELVVNDYGMIEMVHQLNLHNPMTLGILLTKRRKDPRLKYKNDMNYDQISCAVNSEFYKAYLVKENIIRYSYEASEYVMKKEDHIDFYMPYYVTNVSSACTLHAVYHGNRSILFVHDTCDQICLEHKVLYPSHLNMEGRYNTLQSADSRSLTDSSYVSECLGEDVRIIINL